MKIDILTVFPEMFESVLGTSILARAIAKGLIRVELHDIRPFSDMKHKNTDDYPFGGGAGMLMTSQPIADCIKSITDSAEGMPFRGKRVYMSPKGVTLTQPMAEALAKEENLVILCGHYEGVDQRVLDRYIDEEISIGDYVLTGGETAAMVLIDCVSRLIPGVLGSEESPVDESFSGDGLLEYPQYTRPRVFEDMEVPQVLLDGNHALIRKWRREQSLLITLKRRPELIRKAFREGKLDKKDLQFLRENGWEPTEV